MTRDDVVDAIMDWCSDTFGVLAVDSMDVDALIERLENLGMVIES